MLCCLCFLQGCLQIRRAIHESLYWILQVRKVSMRVVCWILQLRRAIHESVYVEYCRPKTFLHGQAAAVGVAVFNGVGETSILATLHLLMKKAAIFISTT